VTAQQVQLQRRQIVRVDARLGEVAEAGIDAVDGVGAGGFPIDDGSRRGDAGARLGCERHLGTVVGNGEQIGDREL
jgi:hypothetical protein